MNWIKTVLLSLCCGLVALSCWASSQVNINQASAKEIAQALKGVGLKKAEQIIQYRKAHGNFTDIKDLAKVKGISLKTVEKNKERIILSKK